MCNQVPKLPLVAKLIIFPAAFFTLAGTGVLLGYGRTRLLQWLDERDESRREKMTIEAIVSKYVDEDEMIREALRAKYRAKYGDKH